MLDSEQTKYWPSFPGRKLLLVFNDNEKPSLMRTLTLSFREKQRPRVKTGEIN